MLKLKKGLRFNDGIKILALLCKIKRRKKKKKKRKKDAYTYKLIPKGNLHFYANTHQVGIITGYPVTNLLKTRKKKSTHKTIHKFINNSGYF